MDFVIGILGAGVGGGIMSIALALINRRWKKQDDQEEKGDRTKSNAVSIQEINKKIDTMVQTQGRIVRALKISIAYDINYLGGCCIYAGEITLDNKRQLVEMHKAYEDLPGDNGLCMIMGEIDKLRVVPNEYEDREDE